MSTETGGEPSTRPPEEESEFSRVLDEFSKRFDRVDWVEVAATVVLSLAVLVTAWSAYQAARWGGVQSINASQYAGHLIESSEVSTLIETQLEIDSQAMSTWLIMAAEDNEQGMRLVEDRFGTHFGLRSKPGLVARSMAAFHQDFRRTCRSTKQDSKNSSKRRPSTSGTPPTRPTWPPRRTAPLTGSFSSRW